MANIPTIFSISSESTLNTIHALGGRGLCVALPDEKTAAKADVIQVLDLAHAEHWLSTLSLIKQKNANTRIAMRLDTAIAAKSGLLNELLTLVDIVVCDLSSLSTLISTELSCLFDINHSCGIDNTGAINSVLEIKNALMQVKEHYLLAASTLVYQSNTGMNHWDCVDMGLYQGNEFLLESTYYQDESSHAFITALVTAIAQDYPFEDAFVVARAYCTQTTLLGRCHGWPKQRQYFPSVVLPNSPLGTELGLAASHPLSCDFASCDTTQLGLYPVVDTVEWLEKVLKSGVKTLQLRIKDKSDDEVADDIKAAVLLGQQYDARLFINDYWQLAIEHGAYGVHLGQEDMLVADFTAIKKAGLRLGLSTHGYYELLRAHAIKPSYIALGHIFPTVTKDMPSKPQGLLRLQKYADLMQDYPLVAIGGISLDRAPLVAATGVGSIAVVTAITRADDYRAAIASFEDVLAGYGIASDSLMARCSHG